jgi:hypothetical protein
MNRAMVLPLIFVVAVLAVGGVTVAWHTALAASLPNPAVVAHGVVNA